MDCSVDSIIERARRVASSKRAGWNKTRLAREAEMGINGLVDLFKPDFNPTAETLRKLEPVIQRAEAELTDSAA